MAKLKKNKNKLLKKQKCNKFFSCLSNIDRKVIIILSFFALSIAIAGITSIRYAMWAYSTNAQQVHFLNNKIVDNELGDGLCGVVAPAHDFLAIAKKALTDTCQVKSIMVPVASRVKASGGGDESLYKVDLDPGRCLNKVEMRIIPSKQYHDVAIDGAAVKLSLDGEAVGKYQLLKSVDSDIWLTSFKKVPADYLDLFVYGDYAWKYKIDYAALVITTCSCTSDHDCDSEPEYDVDLLKDLD